MKNKIALIIIFFVTVAIATPIHFLLVNDCHAVMESWGHRDDITLEGWLGGYDRAVHIVDSLRAEHPDLLFLHAGDVITGDFLSTITVGRGVWDLWLNAGVEAFAIGNHEFEYGPGALDTVLGTIDVPLVCANLDADGYPNLQSSFEPYRIFTFPGDSGSDSIRIAVFSVCTEETDEAGWTEPLDLGNVVTGIDTFGLPSEADAAIALTHLDLSDDYDVAALPFIDAVLGGHDHFVADSVIWQISGVDSTPILKAGPLIIRVGHLTMDYNDTTGLSFVDWDPIPVDGEVPEDPDARALLDAWRDTIAANPYVGYDPYDSVAFYADSNISSSPSGIPDSGWNDSPLGNIVSEAYRRMLSTDIGVEGRGALRMSILSGPITFADLYRIAPVGRHPGKGLNSRLIKVKVTGQQLKTMLEYALLSSAFSAEVFPEFSGMRVEYNSSASLLNQINTATWMINGMLWESSDTYEVAGTEMLEYAMSLIGIPSEEITYSDSTVWEALVAHCGSPEFTPTYRSDGRLKDIAAGIVELATRPGKMSLRVWPNPFNAMVNIESDRAIKSLEIFDVAGKLIKKIFDRNSEGKIVWKPDRAIATGIYFLRAKHADGTVSRKPIVFMK